MDEPARLVLLEERAVAVKIVPIVVILGGADVADTASVVAAGAPGPLRL